MKFDRRIKNLEKTVDDIRAAKGGLRIVWIESDESYEECLKRHGVDRDSPGLKVWVVRWRKGLAKRVDVQQTTVHEKGIKNDTPRCDKSINTKNEEDNTLDINAEISQLKKQLREEDSLNDQEIDELVATESEPESKQDNGLLKVSPMRADDLTRFGR